MLTNSTLILYDIYLSKDAIDANLLSFHAKLLSYCGLKATDNENYDKYFTSATYDD